MSDADDPRARVAERLAPVRARFLDGLGGRIADLSEQVRIAASGDPAAAGAALADLRRGLHSLAGSAPTLGLGALGARARSLETALEQARLVDGRLAPESARSLRQGITLLESDR